MGDVTELAPSASVIVPSYRGGPRLRRCIEAILAQDHIEPYEVIVVRSGVEGTGDSVADGDPLPEDERLRVIDYRERLPAAVARNRAVVEARGPAFAFTDADAIPERGWLRTLLAASNGMRVCVGGGISNGTPGSVAGTAEYIVAFLDLHPRRRTDTAWHGATCNLLVPRPVWDRYGPFPEDMNGGEDTLLTSTLHREGLYRFAGEATVAHLNRTRIRDVVAHQYGYGRFTPLIARRGPYEWGVFVRHRALVPLAGLGRLLWVTRRVRHAGLRPGVAVRAAPIVLLLIGAWTAGVLRAPRPLPSAVSAADDSPDARR